jgi:hypothetical protein
VSGEITEIKRALAQRAQPIAEMLLPRGRKEGHEWRAGGVQGEEGKSLGVHLAGSKAGVWCDFDTGEAGDLLDLWMATTGLKLVDVLERARDYLGMERPKAFSETKKMFKRPPKPSCVTPKGKALAYLREDRNISAETITAYKIGERGDVIVFPFMLPDGTLALVKERKVGDGEKPVPTSKDCEKTCFGWQSISDHEREVVITEGEIDALSWHSYHRPALSVPFGGGGGNKQDWIENDFERFERFETIYLALDNDETGDAAVVEIARRLGRHRCRRVTHPRGLKDGNDCLKADVPVEEMTLALKEARGLDLEVPENAALRLQDWLERDIPAPDLLLGSWLSTTSRLLLVGPTGIGKSMFGLAIAIAVSSGPGFLHWAGHRRSRVLYIDGEMSRRTMKMRLQDAVRHAGEKPDDLVILSKEDFEDMPPLNTEEGQEWLDAFIETNGPFDLIIFDNIQALLIGDMKDEEQWANVLPWVRDLTRRSIGQIWFHHTGHDESRSYGSKAREWQMDTVALMERVEAPNADLAFTLKFTKARERTAENRRDFDVVTMTLTDGEWAHSFEPVASNRLTPNQKTMLAILADAALDVLTLEEWNERGRKEGIGERRRADFCDIRRALKERKLVREYADKWFVSH